MNIKTLHNVDTTNIDETREELIKRWGDGGIIKPSEVEELAEKILSLPIEEQKENQLLELATLANTSAYFVGFIFEEYKRYYIEIYGYDFAKEKVTPSHDAYAQLGNKLKEYRNQAYYNLGKKALERGDTLTAFFMFRDAFRLDSFTKEDGDHKGMRYKSELEMKKILGISDIETYVYWK